MAVAAVLHLAGFGDVVEEFLRVPGGGGAAFGAVAANSRLMRQLEFRRSPTRFFQYLSEVLLGEIDWR